ncbi:MAG TPA: ABC transporter substrate-binding protein [Oscillospiraceae bacterium]|nr:ABC transporter substrate-binding protein [Oscillospiraceae bacterium]HPF55879.1 ABC transporter substrate-binding protein [Clostridiales bacterium]HPK35176.1 ABC transporter substrate-binding protein [Oscillospiraceae bacterium]HPR74979.1 ABC transporter substrate-binding protein [Oscillospiraceae bacterium]
MKRLFKLSTSLLICGALFLTGCGAPSTSLPNGLVGQAVDYPETMNIIAPFSFTNGDAENAEQAEQQWLDEMSERYGTKFSIAHLTWKNGYNTDSDAYIQAINILSGEETFSGMVYINGYDDIQTGIDNGTLVPLEDYLANNAVWNALPEELKATFEYQGHIYAIPTSVSRSISVRYIDNEALDQINIPVTDLDSLKRFAVAYSEANGQSALYSYYLSQIEDVINAFGLYSANIYSSPFGYDPGEDCFLDFLTKGSAINALEYLRELCQAGALVITKDYSAPSESFSDGTCPTYYGGSDKEDCTIVWTLNTAYPRILNNMVDGFVMAKDTDQPQETVDLFVNMLFGSESNYLECWLGSSDNYILNSDGTITIKMVQNADGSYTYPCTPDLTGKLTDIFSYSDANIYYSQDGVVVTDSESDAGEANQYYQTLYNLLQTRGIMKIAPVYSLFSSPSYFSSTKDIRYLYQKCIWEAITDTDYTVQEIVMQYRLDLLNMGGNQMLDEMNAAIGKETAYYYG